MINEIITFDVRGGWIPFVDVWECPNCKNWIEEKQKKCECGQRFKWIGWDGEIIIEK